LLVCVLLGLVTASLSKDDFLIRRARTDSLLTDFGTPALSGYLRAHRDGAHYEVAGANINDVVGLVARDDLPVLVLNSVDGSLTRTKTLEAQVAERRVRFYFVAPHPCHGGRYCPYNQIWAYAHSSPVYGQPSLRRFTAPASVPAATPLPSRAFSGHANYAKRGLISVMAQSSRRCSTDVELYGSSSVTPLRPRCLLIG
jgi:hypothetical protein